MPNPLAIDAHAHICTEETMKLLNKETPKVASALKEIAKDVYEWTVAGVPYRPLPLGGFDIEQRLKDMKASDVDMQVLSNTPQTFLYNQDAGLTAAACIVQNDQIAKHVRDYPRSFYGIATLPMQAPKAAADELERAISKLGLKGMQIGSNINGKNLDEPEFEPVWQVANQHNAFCMVHPNNVAGIDRMKNYYLNNLIGNPLDTTIAAACLVFGGVIERYPNIRFYMVHGGGFTPYQAGRWQHGWHVRPEPQKHLKKPPAETIRTFYWDTILHSKPQLEFLVQEFGAAHVILGSDYPYDMGTFECARQVKALSVRRDGQADHAQRPGAEAPGGREVMSPRRALPRSAIAALIKDAMMAVGVPDADAAKVAELMLEADLTGADAHGVFRLPQYVRRIKAGGVNPRASIKVEKTAPATAMVDGDNGMGHLVMQRAADTAIALAKENGVAWVGARRSNHAGAAGTYAAMALPHDMIGIYSAVANANHMPAWGAAESLLEHQPDRDRGPGRRGAAGGARHRHHGRLLRHGESLQAAGQADAGGLDDRRQGRQADHRFRAKRRRPADADRRPQGFAVWRWCWGCWPAC